MSEYYFSPWQIAEMAMGTEKAGEKFYTTLASLVGDKKLKGIFTILAKAELKHCDTFKRIADSFRNADADEYSIDLSKLMQSQVDELTGAVFNFQVFSHQPTSIQQALNIAIHAEEMAIRIYTDIYSSFVGTFHDILSKIIEEEKKHLEMLNNVKAKLNL